MSWSLRSIVSALSIALVASCVGAQTPTPTWTRTQTPTQTHILVLVSTPGPDNPLSQDYAVDRLNATALQFLLYGVSGGGNDSITVQQIAVSMTGTLDPVNDLVPGSVRLYEDDGTVPGFYDASDTLIMGGLDFSATGAVTFSGSPINNLSIPVTYTFSSDSALKLLVVFDLDSPAGMQFSVRLSNLSATGYRYSILWPVGILSISTVGNTHDVVAWTDTFTPFPTDTVTPTSTWTLTIPFPTSTPTPACCVFQDALVPTPFETETELLAVAVDPYEGRVYAPDTMRNVVYMFNLEGSFLGSFGAVGQFDRIVRAAVGPDHLLYLVEDSGSRALVVDPLTGTTLASYTPGGFGRGIFVAPNGDMYVSCEGQPTKLFRRRDSCLRVDFDPPVPLTLSGNPSAGQVNEVRTEDSYLYAIDNGSLVKYQETVPGSTTYHYIETMAEGDPPGQELVFPSAHIQDAAGNHIVFSSGDGRLAGYDASFGFVFNSSIGLQGGRGIATDGTGTVYVAMNDHVGRYTMDCLVPGILPSSPTPRIPCTPTATITATLTRTSTKTLTPTMTPTSTTTPTYVSTCAYDARASCYSSAVTVWGGDSANALTFGLGQICGGGTKVVDGIRFTTQVFGNLGSNVAAAHLWLESSGTTILDGGDTLLNTMNNPDLIDDGYLNITFAPLTITSSGLGQYYLIFDFEVGASGVIRLQVNGIDGRILEYSPNGTNLALIISCSGGDVTVGYGYAGTPTPGGASTETVTSTRTPTEAFTSTHSPSPTFTATLNISVPDLTIPGGYVVTLANNTFAYDSIDVQAGATLVIGGAVTLNIQDFLNVDGTVWGRGKGHGSTFVGGCGPGAGYGDGSSGSLYHAAAGGGHGGRGGAGGFAPTVEPNPPPGGNTYDDAVQPVLPGSCGGEGDWAVYGYAAGGAVLVVNASSGNVTINGMVNMAGAAGNDIPYTGGNQGGGGSGGTISIDALVIQGAGTLTASGGHGGYATRGAGGGGGGIVRVCAGSGVFGGTVDVTGGAFGGGTWGFSNQTDGGSGIHYDCHWPTPTWSPTRTVTLTPTITNTPTSTITPTSNAGSLTPSPTTILTLTNTPTSTRTPTNTVTSTRTPTEVLTFAPTHTITATPTVTYPDTACHDIICSGGTLPATVANAGTSVLVADFTMWQAGAIYQCYGGGGTKTVSGFTFSPDSVPVTGSVTVAQLWMESGGAAGLDTSDTLLATVNNPDLSSMFGMGFVPVTIVDTQYLGRFYLVFALSPQAQGVIRMRVRGITGTINHPMYPYLNLMTSCYGTEVTVPHAGGSATPTDTPGTPASTSTFTPTPTRTITSTWTPTHTRTPTMTWTPTATGCAKTSFSFLGGMPVNPVSAGVTAEAGSIIWGNPFDMCDKVITSVGVSFVVSGNLATAIQGVRLGSGPFLPFNASGVTLAYPAYGATIQYDLPPYASGTIQAFIVYGGGYVVDSGAAISGFGYSSGYWCSLWACPEPGLVLTVNPAHTPNASFTQTATSTPTLTPSGTWDTPTSTPSVFITPTGTWDTPTSTDSPTQTATWTDTPAAGPGSVTSTPTYTFTRTFTPTFTRTPTGTYTPTSTPQPILTATATAVMPLLVVPVTVDNLLPYPNPATVDKTTLYFEVMDTSSGAAKLDVARSWDPDARVEFKAYTTAYRLLWTAVLTGAYVGGNEYDWDLLDKWGKRLSNGTYFIQITVTSKGKTSTARQMLMVLR